MANLLRTEWYKLWHSWYFWGIGIFTFLLSSILLLDSKGKTSNLVMASLYNTPLLYFLIIVFIALFIGNDLGGRTLNAYLTAGHKRYAILVCEEFSCLEFHMNRDTISWILKKNTGGRYGEIGKTDS